MPYPHNSRLPSRLAALLTAAAVAAPGAALANSLWGSIGSTGIVDDGCYPNVRLNLFDARMAPATTQATCILRYQVSATFGLANGQSYSVFLNSHLLDNGPMRGSNCGCALMRLAPARPRC